MPQQIKEQMAVFCVGFAEDDVPCFVVSAVVDTIIDTKLV